MSDLHFRLKNGMKMPRLGMGTWMLGEHLPIYQQEKKALQAGLDAGFTLIDTAEMYGNGLSYRSFAAVFDVLYYCIIKSGR